MFGIELVHDLIALSALVTVQSKLSSEKMVSIGLVLVNFCCSGIVCPC